jgi:hypothetical protein
MLLTLFLPKDVSATLLIPTLSIFDLLNVDII